MTQGTPLARFDLVRLPVDVILADSAAASIAAKQATTSIPVVMGVVSDPIGIGLVESLARPGGNVTGFNGTVASYVNPNARCPVCRAPVIFYRSPYDGRVFFDPPLGPPWPKHPCTDSRRFGDERRRWPIDYAPLPLSATSTPVAPVTRTSEPSPQELGWEPLCSSRVEQRKGVMQLIGDLANKLTELTLLEAASFDRKGPIWTSEYEDAPGLYAIAVLYSDAWGVHEQYLDAYESRLSPLGPELLRRALTGDAAALAKVGRIMLEKLGDFASARIYLERAFLAGAVIEDLTVGLAVAALFSEAEGRKVVSEHQGAV